MTTGFGKGPKSPIFGEHRDDYLRRLAGLDWADVAGRLGLGLEADALRVSLFAEPFVVRPHGIFGPDARAAAYTAFVIICRYLLMCPAKAPKDAAWAAFRDFKDAGPLLTYFAHSVEGLVAKSFAGRLAELQAAGRRFGAQPAPPHDFPYDLVMAFDALPRVPVLLLFNDAAEGFGPRCVLLFQRGIAGYLDMETVAMVGAYLADGLTRMAAGAAQTR
jgi:hypothetical protein